MLKVIRVCLSHTLALLALVDAGALKARAQEASAPEVETRVFDIRSLLLEVPDYRAAFSDLRSDDLYRAPAASTATAPTQTLDPRTAPPTKAQSIMGLIIDTVQPDTWRSNGGEFDMEFYAGLLVVRQTKPAIEEVDQLLNLIRAARIRKVTVEAWFVTVPARAAERKAAAPALSQTRFTPEEFQAGLESKPDSVSITRLSLSGFDGQRIYAVSGRQFNAVVGLQPVVDQQAVAYQPITRQLNSGISLEVQPVAEPERGLVLLDLRASLGQLQPGSNPQDHPESRREFDLNTPAYQVAHFATSVALPLEHVSRVGLTRLDENQDVLLFVQPGIE